MFTDLKNESNNLIYFCTIYFFKKNKYTFLDNLKRNINICNIFKENFYLLLICLLLYMKKIYLRVVKKSV